MEKTWRSLSQIGWLFPVALTAVIACSAGSGGDGGGGSDGATGPTGPSSTGTANQGALAITPNPVLVTVDGADVQVQLKAQSGGAGDVTTKSLWSLADPSLGTITAGGLLTVPKTITKGGNTKIAAAYGNETGQADLEIKLVPQDVIDPSAPPDVKGWFDNGDGAAAPTWAYPYDRTMLPKNQPELEFQWTAVAGAGAYRIKFESPTYTRSVFLGPSVCSASQCKYSIAEQQWLEIAGGLAGADVELSIAASAGPDAPAGVAKETVSFSPDSVLGGLYYWSTTITGLYRAPLGAKKATAFITNGNETGCVGCHAVSPDGKKVAAEFGSAEGIGGGIVSGDNGQQYVLPVGEAGPWNLQTFSPDGNMLLVNWHGEMHVIDTNTGSFLYNVPPLPGGYGYAQPEWSPDGQNIVFARMPNGSSNSEWNANNTGDIMIMPFNGGAFGPPTMIVEAAASGELHFYPTWSPDSKWIIFNSCVGCGTYNPSGTRLRMVRAEAGNTPIELARATKMMNSATNWPRSAPFLQKQGSLMFFTFSSTAPRGFLGGGNPQIWMAGIDLAAAEAGVGDPSYAPFWLTFQVPTENNHLGTWTQSVACDDPTDCPAGFNCEQGECVQIVPS